MIEIILLLLIDVVILTLSASVNLALRTSAGHMEEAFERRGKLVRFHRLLDLRSQFLIVTGAVRVGAILIVVLLVLKLLDQVQAASPGFRPVIAFLVAWPLCLTFGVAMPTAIARYANERLMLTMEPWLWVMRWILYPLVALLSVFDPLVRRLSGIAPEDEGHDAEEVEREILGAVTEGERQGAVSEDERAMIESVIELRSTHVGEIMTPRPDIIAVPVDADRSEVLTAIRSAGHSRLPVYEETLDHVVGILYAKDLLHLDPAAPLDIRSVMRPPVFVPDTKLVRDLLHEFRHQKVHIAVVLDEYGGTAGLVTIEDILELVVGDIADEYEPTEPEPLVQVDKRTYEVDARLGIDEINDELRIRLPESEYYETIGGYVSTALGRIPRVGEQCEYERVAIQVIDAEPRKINRLRIRLPEPMTQEREHDNGQQTSAS